MRKKGGMFFYMMVEEYYIRIEKYFMYENNLFLIYKTYTIN